MAVLGAMEGAEVGGRESPWRVVLRVREMPLTTSGGVGLGVMLRGVERPDVGACWCETTSLFGAGEFVLLMRPLE